MKIIQFKSQIETLEAQTKHLTGYKKVKYSKKASFFDALSKQWLNTYMSLKEVSTELTEEEYKKYMERLTLVSKKMTDYAILGR